MNGLAPVQVCVPQKGARPRSCDTLKRASSIVLIAAAFGLTGCASFNPPRWSQAYSNVGNQNFAGAGPQTLSSPRITPIGDPGTSAPVEAPDGSVIVSVFGNGFRGAGSRVVRVSEAGGQDVVTTLANFSGQPSTPAVDSAGNIYVTVNALGDNVQQEIVEQRSRVVQIRADGSMGWSIPIYLPRQQNSPPRVFEYNGVTNILVPSRSGVVIRLRVINAQTGEFGEVEACSYPLEQGNLPGTAQPTPTAPPPPPYREYAGIALPPPSGDGAASYLVMTVRGCGIVFYSIATSPANVTWPSSAIYPSLVTRREGSSGDLGSPAIASFPGYAIVREGQVIRAYNYVTGEQIDDWEIPSAFVTAAPAISLNSIAASRGNRVTIFNATTPGTAAGPAVANSVELQRPLGLALTPANLYALGRDGFFRYGFRPDGSLALLASSALDASAGGGMAIGAHAAYIVSRNGNLYTFPN